MVIVLSERKRPSAKLTAEDWFNMGIALGEKGKLEEALEAFSVTTELRPRRGSVV